MTDAVKNLRDGLNRYVGILVSIGLAIGVPSAGWVINAVNQNARHVALIEQRFKHVEAFLTDQKQVVMSLSDKINENENLTLHNKQKINDLGMFIVRVEDNVKDRIKELRR